MSEPRQPRIIICVPSFDMVHAKFAFSLAHMMQTTQGDIRFLNGHGSNIYRLRNTLVKRALENDADYVLFIDSDLSFPPYALARLVNEAVANGRDIIGCNYTARQHPHNQLVQPADGISQSMALAGVCEVGRIPTGFMLVSRRVFDAIGFPYFRGDLIDADGQMLGEDYELCEKARSNGFRIWIDTDLSLQLVHWGGMGFRMSSGGYELVETGE